jgi:hypothetical protein
MPRFYETVTVDVDIKVDEFLDKCDYDDIKDLIISLREDGYLTSDNMTDTNVSYMEEKHQLYCNYLRNSYLQMSNEDMEIIKNLTNKYGGY